MESELAMLEICQEIGAVTEWNNSYTFKLAQQLSLQDKSLEELTISEFLTVVRACHAH